MRHKSYSCDFKKLNGSMIKTVWIPKRTIRTNLKGSKMTWTPKIST